MRRGITQAAGAYLVWGLLPIYWKLLQAVPTPQLLGHRIVWSFAALVAYLMITRRWEVFRSAVAQPRVLRVYLAAAVLIGGNWLVYVWAVNAGYIVETSLGYFINPLLSVLLGVVFLRERLRPAQWLPIGLAASGVLYLTFTYGAPPWIALTLAFTFAAYGLLKKIAPLSAANGLTLETGLLLGPALAVLVSAEAAGQGAFTHTGLTADLLLLGAGLVTTVPLLMFASAAQAIPLSLVGVLQYIAPTLQFLLGVLVYHEPFSARQFVGYAIVWTALVIFAAESGLAYRAQARGTG